MRSFVVVQSEPSTHSRARHRGPWRGHSHSGCPRDRPGFAFSRRQPISRSAAQDEVIRTEQRFDKCSRWRRSRSRVSVQRFSSGGRVWHQVCPPAARSCLSRCRSCIMSFVRTPAESLGPRPAGSHPGRVFSFMPSPIRRFVPASVPAFAQRPRRTPRRITRRPKNRCPRSRAGRGRNRRPRANWECRPPAPHRPAARRSSARPFVGPQ